MPLDKTFAPAEIEPRHRVLEAHAPRQAQRVGDRSLARGVMPEAHPTRRGPELGRMNGDHRAQSGLGIGEQMDAFMRIEIGEAPAGGH